MSVSLKGHHFLCGTNWLAQVTYSLSQRS